MDNHGHEFEWNDIYTGSASDYMEPDAQLLEIIDALKPGRALDVGCGSGGLLAALAERGWEVAGIDIAPKAIEAAQKVLDARGVQAELAVLDAAAWRPDGQYDLITSSFALPAKQVAQSKLFRTVREALAPGGTVLIKDFDSTMKRYKEFSPYHCPTVEELRTAFEGWQFLRAEVVDTPAHDHDGSGANAGEQWTAALLHARRPEAPV